MSKALCNPKSFVPLRHAPGTREGTPLELFGAPSDRQMNDGDIFGLARACGNDIATDMCLSLIERSRLDLTHDPKRIDHRYDARLIMRGSVSANVQS